MGTFVVTGSASGIGAASAATLADAGHRVIGIDVHDADIIADLGTATGREHAVEQSLRLSAGRLDGVAAIAGVGPDTQAAETVMSINYFGTVALLEGLRPALAASGAGRAVVIGSNSASTAPVIDQKLAEAALADDEQQARELARGGQAAMPSEILRMAPSITAYATSKLALAWWVRTTAVRPEWARQGVLLNAIAPGPVVTPLLRASTGGAAERDPDEMPVPMPLGIFGQPEDVAFWVHQFLRPEARFTTGAVLYVDGGTDAAMRPQSHPTAMPMPDFGLGG
jgi:NAD(P)-dependent dehydrogenase (short-subunit alcohol dehydrogenase family)